MDKIIKRVAILKHDEVQRRNYEQAGWVLLHECASSDLVTYGYPQLTHVVKETKSKAKGLLTRITRPIMDGIKRGSQWITR